MIRSFSASAAVAAAAVTPALSFRWSCVASVLISLSFSSSSWSLLAFDAALSLPSRVPSMYLRKERES
jgi:hypothetical protein